MALPRPEFRNAIDDDLVVGEIDKAVAVRPLDRHVGAKLAEALGDLVTHLLADGVERPLNNARLILGDCGNLLILRLERGLDPLGDLLVDVRHRSHRRDQSGSEFFRDRELRQMSHVDILKADKL